MDCSCVIDTSGLHAIAKATGNLRPALLAKLEDGTIGVPSWAWQEFEKIYEDEAEALSQQINKRVQFNAQVYARAARLTEELNLGFSRGAYDNHVELFSASIAINKAYTVLTWSTTLAPTTVWVARCGTSKRGSLRTDSS